MAEQATPEPLAAPTPRRVGINCSPLRQYAVVAGFIGIFLLVWLLISVASNLKVSALAQGGVAMTATITSIQPMKGQTYLIRYRFEPLELAHRPVKYESGETVLNNDRDLEVGGPISVTYDPRRPDRSLSSAELSQSKQGDFWPKFAVVFASFGLPLLLAGALTIINYRRQKWILQWGKFAPARIIDEQYGRTAKRIYTFEDDQGVARSGKCPALPIGEDLDFDSRARRDRYLANPFAVYDPRDSQRHVLYPGTIALLH